MRPGAPLGAQQTTTVTVKAVDMNVPSITVVTADGRTLTRKIAEKKNLEGVKAGDQIDITYTQAVVVSAEPGEEVARPEGAGLEKASLLPSRAATQSCRQLFVPTRVLVCGKAGIWNGVNSPARGVDWLGCANLAYAAGKVGRPRLRSETPRRRSSDPLTHHARQSGDRSATRGGPADSWRGAPRRSARTTPPHTRRDLSAGR